MKMPWNFAQKQRAAGALPPVSARRAEAKKRLAAAAAAPAGEVCRGFGTAADGLSGTQAEESRARFGANTVARGRRVSAPRRLAAAFFSPFTMILLLLAAVSMVTDVLLAAPGSRDPATVLIITVMVLLSGVLRFVQESRSDSAAARLSAMIRTTACVQRRGAPPQELPLAELAVGDLVLLSAGDLIPADLRLISAKDLFVAQSALTGESEPAEKTAAPAAGSGPDTPCLAFMGSTVVSGSAAAVVVAVGGDTLLGEMSATLSEKPQPTAFDKGVSAVSWLLIRFMLVMVPVVFFLSGLTKGDWLGSALFAISVAVGLTPEMLPMIVTTCLARGAVELSREQVIVKNLGAIQNLGAMDVLCTDKTGTLTRDRVELEYHLDVNGREDARVLRHAFLNSYYQTGLRNLMDIAIIEHTRALAGSDPAAAGIESRYRKVDEIPFDFERRRMSVVVADAAGKTQMITKGAVEEMLRISAHVEYDGRVEPLTEEKKAFVRAQVDALSARGMRVLAVAQKTNPSPVGAFCAADESDMVLIGYLAFLDPPKESAAAALKALQKSGVDVKVLTGDSEKVTLSICRQVGLAADALLLGTEVDAMDDAALRRRAPGVTVFARLSPGAKARVVQALRDGGHVVGYLGDGINDAAAMRAADVGISVDTAVDIARESAGVILLKKDLMVLEKGILAGRRTCANMLKYIKMTVSSNFGNMLSVLAASAFLPFLPMAPLHLLLLNLIYDVACAALPWDNVDAEILAAPRRWETGSIRRFLFCFGPTSSVFDITTYLLLYFALCPAVCGGSYHALSAAGQAQFIALFRAGWFVESMWTQTFVLQMLRTARLPFVHSRASAPLLLTSAGGAALLTAIPFTPLGALLGLGALPPVYFAGLAATLLCYALLVSAVKYFYVRRCGALL